MESYELYRKNEEWLSKQVLWKMSKLNKKILSNIDYDKSRTRRNENFQFLHSELQSQNELALEVENLNGPMVYPFLIRKEGVRQKLIEEQIYVPQYWKEVRYRTEADWF